MAGLPFWERPAHRHSCQSPNGARHERFFREPLGRHQPLVNALPEVFNVKVRCFPWYSQPVIAWKGDATIFATSRSDYHCLA